MIIFKDLYDAYLDVEAGAREMDLDIDNVGCGIEKCILLNEQQAIVEAYQEIAGIVVDFAHFDIDTLFERIEACMECISLMDEPIEETPPLDPDESLCPPGSILITGDQLTRFKIYESTVGGATTTQEYTMTKAAMPYSFLPQLLNPDNVNEKYLCEWSDAKDAIVITCTNKDDTLPIQDGSFNICRVDGELTPAAAAMYGVTTVTACEAILLTGGTQFLPTGPLTNSLDKAYNTSCSIVGGPLKASIAFRFRY